MLTIREKSNIIYATSGSDCITCGKRHVFIAVCNVSFEIKTSRSIIQCKDNSQLNSLELIILKVAGHKNDYLLQMPIMITRTR